MAEIPVTPCHYPSSSSGFFFIHAQVNCTHHNVLIDIDSDITIIHDYFLQHLRHNTLESIPKSNVSANGTTIQIIGQAKFEIKINGLSTYVTATMATNLVTDVLLETDWINHYVLYLDICKQRLILQDYTGRITTTPLIQPTTASCASVLIFDQLTISQYSECTVKIKVQIPDNPDVVFEPSEHFHQKSILLPNALLQVKIYRTQLTIINAKDHLCTLSPNTCLGTVSSSAIMCTIASSQYSTPVHHQSSTAPHRWSNPSHPCLCLP